LKAAPQTAERPRFTSSPRSAAALCEAVARLRADVVEEGDEIFERWLPRIERHRFAPSALNLARYVAIRRHELRELQLELMPWGLSSLGRCEARVIENLDAVIGALERMDTGSEEAPTPPSSAAYFRGHDLLREETEAALGPAPQHRDVRIMVTMPSEASDDYGLVRDLVERGMDIARINCAHDEPDSWKAIAQHVRRASDETTRRCGVCMDICGPRARTTAVEAPSDLRLKRGDRMLLRGPATAEATASLPGFASSLPEVVPQLRPGDSVFIDEGKLGAVVERRDEAGVVLRVTHARAKGGRVKSDKGLNFPDTELRLDPLTPKDLGDLDVIAEIADMVGHSFVQRPGDIELLQEELAVRGRSPGSIALVVKVETKLAVRNLPELIVAGAGRQALAVMIARGDLAVELGYRRMAELQEEILWLCEAAHVPVIWATQVLDTFVHKGTGARAEITDAAMAERAECVLLNKGPYVAEAVSLLEDMLRRMEGHQFKKASRMRRLHSW
jgi:pyruvate kinase